MRVVLALPAEQEMYSTELVRRIGVELQQTASEGAMCPLLSRLRRSGRIAGDWRESASGPPRRYYTLTQRLTGRRLPRGAGFLELSRLP